MKKRFTEEQIVKALGRELESENAKLKRLVADMALNIEVSKDVNSKKW